MLSLAIALGLSLSPQLPGDAMQEQYGQRLTPEAKVYQTVSPSVVRVELWGKLGVEAKVGGRTFDTSSFVKMSSGTGVVYSEDGLILTNSHVITPSNPDLIAQEGLQIRVLFAPEFADSMAELAFDAKLIRKDPQWDLALLQIDSESPFKAAPFGQSGDLLIGEKVVVLGALLDGSLSLSSGVLSGLNRQVTMKIAEDEYKTFRGLIQTDAAVNEGNSGGPLLNIYGELIGINVAMLDDTEGVSYAIPVDRIHESLTQQLMRRDFWVGMTVEGNESNDAPTIVKVHPRGPAALAGVLVGDRILSVDQKPVPQFDNYSRCIRSKKGGDELLLVLRRGGTSLQRSLPLMPWAARDSFGLLGLNLVRHPLQFPTQNGEDRIDVCLRITEVHQDSPAQKLGLKKDDLILAVGVRPTKAAPDGWARVRSASEMVSFVRGPTFRHGEDNIWILRGSESFYGQLYIDDPEVFSAPQ